MPDITVQPIAFDQWASAWQLRLRALQDHPDAFGQPYEHAASLSPEQVRESIAGFWTGGDNQVFVAVAPDATL
ncbi:MAG TPA: hypothetical protein VD767_06820, partial [Thermomicrobiales bacterium]|nr:hypothetical protein [Thermomicrobiales bacterium]